jgi:hypothetical protein
VIDAGGVNVLHAALIASQIWNSAPKYSQLREMYNPVNAPEKAWSVHEQPVIGGAFVGVCEEYVVTKRLKSPAFSL